VRDVGKHVRHAPKPEVTDDNLKVWFTDLKALLSDPTFHKANPRAQDAIDQLDKRKTDEGVLALQTAENIATQNIKSLNESDQSLFKSDLKKGLIVYHGTNNCSLPLDSGTTLVPRQTELTCLGKTRSHVYANMIERMLRSTEKKEESLVQDLSEYYKNNGQPHALPECFDERNYACCGLAKLIYAIGKLAAYSLLGDNKSLMEEHQIRELRKDETTLLLKSGLLSKTSLKTISGESNVYTFLHQTYKEMLACVFLSSQGFDSDIWRKFKENFDSVVSPDILSFLCVMNYENGRKCLDTFNERKRLFVRD
ncbi:hypothetical protein MAR_032566, partial [Mya arenaria]